MVARSSSTPAPRRATVPTGRVVNLRPELDSEDAQALLALALGAPSPTRLEEVMQMYRFLPEYDLLGYRVGSDVVACIGLHLTSVKEGVIRHLVVLPQYRRQGIGRALVGQALRRHRLARLSAECDADAAEFFRSCGATVESLPSGRFRCVWAIKIV